MLHRPLSPQLKDLDTAIHRSNLHGAWETYRIELDYKSDSLFCDEMTAHVPVRDLSSSGELHYKRNLFSDEKLGPLFGNTTTTDTTQPLDESFPSVPDPACRFVFLWADSGRSRLRVSRTMFTRLMTYHQVMPQFLNFVFVFDLRAPPRGHYLGEFCEQTQLHPASAEAISPLHRSGRRYQLCYSLMAAERRSYYGGTGLHVQEWTIRQAAVYHSFDVENGTALWIIVSVRHELKDRIQAVTGPYGPRESRSFATVSDALRSSFAIHSLNGYWATLSWRWYIQYLESMIEDITDPPAQRRSVAYVSEHDNESIQYAERLKGELNRVISSIDSNISVLAKIKNYYEELARNPQLGIDISGEVTAFGEQLDKNVRDLKERSSFLSQMDHSLAQLIEGMQREMAREGSRPQQKTGIFGEGSRRRDISRSLWAPLFGNRPVIPKTENEQQSIPQQSSATNALDLSGPSNAASFPGRNQGTQVGQNSGSMQIDQSTHHHHTYYDGRLHRDGSASDTSNQPETSIYRPASAH